MKHLLVALWLFGCGPSIEEMNAAADAVAAEHKGAVDARMSMLAKVGADSASVDLATVQPPALGDRPKLQWEDGNVLLTTAKVIAVGDPFHESPPIWLGRPVLDNGWKVQGGVLGGYVYRESVETAVADANRLVESITNLRYAALLRETARVDANDVALDLEAMKGDGGTIGTFSSGAWAGKLLLYDLDDGSLLGGLTIQAQNSETIEITGAMNPVETDLVLNIEAAAHRALTPLSADKPR